jgi:hypothetical protein
LYSNKVPDQTLMTFCHPKHLESTDFPQKLTPEIQ